MASRRIGMFGVEPSEFAEDKNEDGVAALLRRRREELGRDIATVARQLRIRAVYIQAIEEGRLQDLPGTAYAVGFVRAYADYLGLDGNSIVGDYRDELARRSRQNQLIWPVDQVEHKHFPGGVVLVISLVLAVALSGGWYFASQPGGTGIDLIDQVPEFMKKNSGDSTAEDATGDQSDVTSVPDTPTTRATPTTAQAASEIPAAPSPAATEPDAVAASDADAAMDQPGTLPGQPVSETPAANAGDDAALPAPVPTSAATAEPGAADSASEAGESAAGAWAPVTDSAAGAADLSADTSSAPIEEPLAVAAEDPAGQQQVAAIPDRRIVLRAAKDSWVEIFDASQKVVLQRILRAGETYAVPDQPGLVMNTGNAGGLVIEVDGQAQPSLGSIGVVKRGVVLAPEAFIAQ